MLVFFLPINPISFFQGIFAQSGKRKNITTRAGFWQKRLAFAHIATTRLDITSVLKLAHFIRSGGHSTATHATRARSFFAITLQAEQFFAILRFGPSQHPRSAHITVLVCSATAFDEVLTFAKLSASSTVLTSTHRNLAISRFVTSPHPQTWH